MSRFFIKYQLLIWVFALSSGTLFGQQPKIHRCGDALLESHMEQKYPGYKEARKRTFEQIKHAHVPQTRSSETLRVPVVFHVVYSNDIQNIHDSLIYRQLEILNQAYQHSHADTEDIREEFKELAGNANIEFYLATQDPEGNPTTGITRTQTDIAYFGDIFEIFTGSLESVERIKYTDKGGFDGWPRDRYCNIWIADMSFEFLGEVTPALLGLATPPAFPSLPDNWPEGSIDGLKDGVILQYQTIGDNNPYESDLKGLVSAGRTAVHEVGHYLGLRHIWGDEDNCSGDDGIDDTPSMNGSQQAATCPDASVNTCGVGDPNDLPDHWENYMDYSNDICQRMFTIGQVEHMRKVATLQRDTLLGNLAKKEIAFEVVSLSPNPTAQEIFISGQFPQVDLKITNVLGVPVKYIRQHETKNAINVSDLPAGIYTITFAQDRKFYTGRFTVIK